MSDLSQLLDDLYALPGTDADEAPAAPTRAPEWSSEEALDEVFGSWVPGPGDDATAAERALVASAIEAAAVDAPTVDEWLIDTEPSLPEPAGAHEVVAAPFATAALRWSPSDDDILPRKRARSFRLR